MRHHKGMMGRIVVLLTERYTSSMSNLPDFNVDFDLPEVAPTKTKPRVHNASGDNVCVACES